MSRSPLALATKLFGSSVLAQVAVLAATAYAARQLNPHDFAIYGAVGGVSAVLATINTLAAETRLAVVDHERSQALLRTGHASIALSTALGVLVGLPALLLGHTWGLVLLLGAGIGALMGAQQMLTSVVLRRQHQSLLARGRLVQGFTNAALIVCLLFVPMAGYLTLCLAWLFSLVLGVGIIWLGCRDQARFALPRRGDWGILKHEVGQQPVANLLAGAVANMPLILLPAVGQTIVAGAWALVNRFLNPMVNTSFSTLQPLYYGRIAEILRGGDVRGARDFHARWLRWLMLGGIPVTLGFLGITWIGLPLLGDQWRVGWLPAVTGAIYFGSLFICLPLSQTLQLLHRVKLAVAWTIVRFIVCAAPLALMPLIGAPAALLTWGVASAVTFFWQLILHRRCFAEALTDGPAAEAAVHPPTAPTADSPVAGNDSSVAGNSPRIISEE